MSRTRIFADHLTGRGWARIFADHLTGRGWARVFADHPRDADERGSSQITSWDADVRELMSSDVVSAPVNQ